ncbi:MAG: choice-of-anchor D domain-containing protein, partial [Paludibacteraceae bacterium]
DGSSVRFTFSQAGGTSVPAYYSDGLRIYNNNTIRIESLGEQDITTIAFTYTVKNDGTLQVVSGGVYDDTTHTWTGSSSDVLLQEVSSTGTGGPQVRITQIVVTLSDAGGESGDEGGEQTTDPVCLTTADERCVFLETPQGWGSSANVYIWNDSSTISLVGEWPGSPATPIYGGLFYKFAIPDNATGDDSQWKIIWNDGSVQTADLPFSMRGLYTGTRYSDIACTSTVTTLCSDAPEGIPDVYFLVDVPRTVLLDTLLASAVIAVNDSVSRGATSHFTLEYHRRPNTGIAAYINPIRMYHNDTLLLSMTGDEIIDSVMVGQARYGSITPVPSPRDEWYNNTRRTRWYGYRIYDYATGPQAIRWVNDSITPEGANGPTESVGDVVVAYHYPRPAQVEQSTAQFAFSELNVFTAGVQEEQTVYLYNYTDAPVTITSIDGLAAPFSLKALPVLPMTLPAQKGIHLTVVFAPTQVDTYADTLTITTDQGNYTVTMSGEAVYYGKEVFPWPATRNNGIVSGATAHGFTYQQIQNTSEYEPYNTDELRVRGGQRVIFRAPSEYVITGIRLKPDYQTHAGPTAVSTQPAAIRAEYVGEIVEEKDGIATITGLINSWIYTFERCNEIVFEALEGSDLRWREIEVQYEYAQELVQSATSLAFPNVMVNSSSRQSVKLTNYTKGAVSISSLSGLAAPFSVLDAPALPVTLQPNQSLTLKVQYAPVAVGSHAGTLLLATSEGEMSVALSGNAVSQTTYPMILAPAHLFYDFDGTGQKGFVDEMPTNKRCFIHTDISTNFAATAQSFTTYSDDGVVRYIEDVNRDSVPDFGVETMTRYWGGPWESTGFDASLSRSDNQPRPIGAYPVWERQPYLFFITNFDLNSDGRFDYLHYINGAWKIGTQQTDGTFVETGMNVMYQDQYETTFDAADWAYRYPDHTPPATMPNFSGACLAKKPGRLNKSAAESIGSKVGAPTRMIDLNMDGYTDLVDEKNGIIYYNMFDGKWVKNEMGGAVQTVYLNDDDIPDFIVYGGGKINTVIYRGNGQFDNTEVWNGFACDDRIFCYDFDKDGQVEILTTFSTLGNQTGAAYTMFFDNDGQGNFTMQPEQTWTDSLYFTCCQDIDGDGYMDLLGIRGCISLGYDESFSSDYSHGTEVEVVWLKGQP